MAYNDELTGCMAMGFTVEEALQNLDEARRDYLETMLQYGVEIPEPAFKPEPIRFQFHVYAAGQNVVSGWQTLWYLYR